MTHLNHQPCPYVDCGSSDAFSWNTEKQVGYCNSCGKGYPTKHMRIHSWAKEQYPLKELDKVQAVQSFSKPQAVNYREDCFGYRGITYDTMKFYKCLTQFDEANNPISHKYVYPSGSIKTRVFPKSFHVASGFKSDELFGMNLFGPGSAKAVTITEGELDAMSAFQMLGSKYPVVSLPSATPGRKLLENCKDWLGSFEKIYFSVDTDEKADKFCLALLDLFPGRVYKVHHGKLKDANEFLTANKVREYVSAWWASPKYTPQNFVSSPHQWEEVLTTEEPYEYKPTPISGLNKITKGFVKGGITVIKALPGTGKTALFRFFEHDLIKNQSARVAVLHMEEMKSTTGRGLASYELGKNVMTKEDAKANGVTEEQVIGVVKELTKDSQFVTFEIDPHDALGSVISCIQTAISVYDVDYIFIDHLQRLAYLSGVDNATASLTELAVKMVDLSKRRNVGIIAISHVNEGGASKYAKAIEEEAIIVMEIERDKFSEDTVARNTTKITVTKNRPFALTGDAGEVYYDPETTLLCERGDSW